jgi:hypothetical protein
VTFVSGISFQLSFSKTEQELLDVAAVVAVAAAAVVVGWRWRWRQ